MLVYSNGSFISEKNVYISHCDRGFLLGDGIFETLKSKNGNIYNFAQHYERLKHSANTLFIPFDYTCNQLVSVCRKLLYKNELMTSTAYIRITLTRGAGERGINISKNNKPRILIVTGKYETPTEHPRAYITSIKRNADSPITYHKTLNYLESILARKEAQDQGFDEGIMLNQSGLITESSIANLFFIKEDGVHTPKIKNGLLPGIIRNVIISLCLRNNIPLYETNIKPEDARTVKEIFQTNSLIEVQFFSSIDNVPLSICKSRFSQKIVTIYNSLKAK